MQLRCKRPERLIPLLAVQEPRSAEEETEIKRLPLDRVGEGVYEHEGDKRWWGFNGLFGGYTISLAALACRRELEGTGRQLRSITMQFLRPVPAKLIRLELKVERSGRAVSFISGRLLVEEIPYGLFLAASSEDQDGQEFVNISMPEVPPFDESGRSPSPPIAPLPVFELFDRWEISRTRDSVFVWVRPKQPAPVDLSDVLMASDVIPPVAIGQVTDPHIAGTIGLTTHLRAPLPVPESAGKPLLVELHTSASIGGHVDETSRVWSPDGLLLAEGLQLRFLRRSEQGFIGRF